MRVRRQLLEHVGAVGDPVLRFRGLLCCLGYAGRMHGQGALVGQEFEQIGRRLLQRDLQRALVGSGDAERFERGAGGRLVDRRGIADRKEQVGVFRAGFRVDDAPEGIDEVRGPDRIAIRPFCVAAQLEAPAPAVRTHRPAFGDAGHDLALHIVDDEALAQVAQQMRFRDGGGLVWIERFGIAVIAAMEDDPALGACGAGRGQDGGERQGRVTARDVEHGNLPRSGRRCERCPTSGK